MKYGFVLPCGDARTAADFAYDAEQAGWDGFFVWEPVWGIDAWVALTAAIRHSDRLGGVVLDSVMPGELDERLAIMERLGGTEAREIARRYWAGEPTDEIREAYPRVCLPLYSQRPGGDPDGPDRLRRITWNPDVLEHFRQVLFGAFDPWPRLGQVTCPTMILAGEHDPVATASAARRLAATLPAAQPLGARRLFTS